MSQQAEPQELSCKELVELVTDYLEEALPLSERQRFDEHLANCRGCRAYVEQIRTTIRLAGSLNEDNIPDEAKDGLLRLFRDWKSGSTS
jgi:predicted anti-sigma-YlaC factor YlaD